MHCDVEWDPVKHYDIAKKRYSLHLIVVDKISLTHGSIKAIIDLDLKLIE